MPVRVTDSVGRDTAPRGAATYSRAPTLSRRGRSSVDGGDELGAFFVPKVGGEGVAETPAFVLRCSKQRVYSKYTMPTSVHIPKPLLVAVDRKARALKISRNRLIVQALEREVTEGSNWSPEFFARLESADTNVEDAADEMLKAIQGRRSSKKPVRL